MTPTEALPLLVVVTLLVASSGVAVDQMTVTYTGDHAVDGREDVSVVAGGTVTVPADTTVQSQVYVVGGTLTVAGTVTGDVTVLGGNLTVADTGAITGTLETLAGTTDVADGAAIGERTRLPVTEPAAGPFGQYGALVFQILTLGLAAWILARRRPTFLENVARTATAHPVVTGVVGALAGLTLLVLFVYMAFTLLLLPVSILGLLGELAVVFYAYVAFGHRIGTHLPTAHTGLAAVLGVTGFLLALELLGRIPLLGAVVQIAVVAIGFGAVLLTFFGLREFHPATIPQ